MSAARRIILLAGTAYSAIAAEARFPKPDFSSGHRMPNTDFPGSEAAWLPWLDVALLALALVAAGIIVHRTRRRWPLLLLGGACLLYFGFLRLGCVCPIGGIQNVAQAIGDPGLGLPVSVLLIVLLPLLAALVVGRVFCGGVCIFGVLQEWVVVKPLRLPGWLAAALGLLPLLYLGAALLMAGTGAGYPLCRFDPFVGFFRFDGPATMLLFGAGLLLLGTVVARPYCRFLCPYGVLLGWTGRLARWRVRATPSACISCHLCADSCPSQVLRPPAALLHDGDAGGARRRAGWLLIFSPLVLLLGIAAGLALGELLATQHRTVALAAQIASEERGLAEPTDASLAYRAGSQTISALQTRAAELLALHRWAGGIVGALLAAGVIGRLLRLGRLRRNRDWRPDEAHCLACLRCAEACPVELARRDGRPVEELRA